MKPIASLAMYARPEIRPALETFWGLLRDALRDDGIPAPDALSENGVGYDFWQAPNLVLGQTCGYSYRTKLRGKVNFVGTLDYSLENCAPGYYRSVIVVRRSSIYRKAGDLNGARFAFNDKASQSGYHGPLLWAQRLGLNFVLGPETGAHRASAMAVVDDLADVAALDAVTWRFMERYDRLHAFLRVIDETPPVPGLPLICAKTFEPERVAGAVRKATVGLDRRSRSVLSIAGLSALSAEDYAEAAFDV